MSTVNGLPAHILLVHAVVVLLPLAAFLLVLTAVWPSARRRLAGPNAILAVIAAGLVPITSEAGEWLEHRVASTDLIHQHAEWGDTAIWFAIPVTVLALVVWWRQRETTGDVPARVSGRTYLAPTSAGVTRVVVVLAVIAAGAASYGTYRIGDSGAKAAWTGNFSTAPVEGAPERPR